MNFPSFTLPLLLSMATLAQAIQGGQPAAQGRFKFAADILIRLNYACGASLITNECVVTSGQCVKGIQGPGNVKVRFNQVGQPLTFSVKSITRPKNFDSTGLLDNDLAVICLTQAVPSEIVPVCLSGSPEIPVGSQLTVIGRGSVDAAGTPSRVLKQLDQSVVSVEECNAAYGLDVIGDPGSQFCAKGPDPTGACRGDQGSAVLRKEDNRHVLIGVVSDTPPSCGGDQPNIYTNVVGLREFLQQSSSGSPSPCPPL